MIYRFRVILDNDTEDDIFRDLEIRETDTLEDLHNTITQSFGFDGLEMASFYISNDTWEQGEEISMLDISEGPDSVRSMNETALKDVVHEIKGMIGKGRRSDEVKKSIILKRFPPKT